MSHLFGSKCLTAPQEPTVAGGPPVNGPYLSLCSCYVIWCGAVSLRVCFVSCIGSPCFAILRILHHTYQQSVSQFVPSAPLHETANLECGVAYIACHIPLLIGLYKDYIRIISLRLFVVLPCSSIESCSVAKRVLGTMGCSGNRCLNVSSARALWFFCSLCWGWPIEIWYIEI